MFGLCWSFHSQIVKFSKLITGRIVCGYKKGPTFWFSSPWMCLKLKTSLLRSEKMPLKHFSFLWHAGSRCFYNLLTHTPWATVAFFQGARLSHQASLALNAASEKLLVFTRHAASLATIKSQKSGLVLGSVLLANCCGSRARRRVHTLSSHHCHYVVQLQWADFAGEKLKVEGAT